MNEYKSRLEQRLTTLARQNKKIKTVWLWRRILVVITAIIIILSIYKVVSSLWLILPVGAYVIFMLLHNSQMKKREGMDRSVRYYENCIARLENKWQGRGNQKNYVDKTHSYAEDLDIFGAGSLFELMDATRTETAERKLASWLISPSSIPELTARHQAVAELKPLIDLREDLAILGVDVQSDIKTEELKSWASAPAILTSKIMPLLALIIGPFFLISIIQWLVFGYGKTVGVAFILFAIFSFSVKSSIEKVMSSADKGGRNLEILSGLLARIEQESFTSPRLRELRESLNTNGMSPSKRIARLSRLIQILDSTRNQFFAPFAAVLLIPAHITYAIDKWRKRSKIHKWLDAVAEIEALSSIAGFAYDHPDYVFPSFTDNSPCFDANDLGHPLIAASDIVRNDVALDNKMQLLIVSGSNMSGKSTLMRSIGINTVLAFAGAPVCANGLKISKLSVGASIHIVDSLQSGASKFYAEITRLQQIVKMTEDDTPLLFLLDEILSGTNSHDRRIGAEAVVKGLIERGAIGVVTTHDLALTKISDSLEDKAINVHFEDHMENGLMKFDYKIHPGVVQKSNAVELMRAVGLNV